MCGLVACWVAWVLTVDLSDTRTVAVGLTGHSVLDSVQRAEGEAGFLWGYWRAGADGLLLSGGRRTVEHKYPAGVPAVHLPVQETEGHLGVPVLVGGGLHLD